MLNKKKLLITPDEELNSVFITAYPPAGVDSGEIVTNLKQVRHVQISDG